LKFGFDLTGLPGREKDFSARRAAVVGKGRNYQPMMGRGREIRRYNFYVAVEGQWQWQFHLEAFSHNEAFRLAMFLLEPRHFDTPIRLEQETPAELREPQKSAFRSRQEWGGVNLGD
jgi:hypothetical protein